MPLKNVLKDDMVRLLAETPGAAALNHSAWQDYCELPVVTGNELFLGVLRYQSLIQIGSGRRRSRMQQNIITTGTALGQLYRLGIASLIRGALDVYNDTTENYNRS
jgi:hypothetical protein